MFVDEERALALEFAVEVSGTVGASIGSNGVVAMAKAFHDFLTGEPVKHAAPDTAAPRCNAAAEPSPAFRVRVARLDGTYTAEDLEDIVAHMRALP